MDKIKSFIKSKIKIVVIVSAVILLLLAILSSFLGISLFQTNSELINTKTILSERENELMSTSRELDETKDQKLALETENADLINQINDLNANRAQLEADIASKQTELEQANVALQGTKRCVALFDNVRGQLNSYNANLEKSGALVLEAIDASINGDEALANAKIDEAVRFSNAAQANLNNINGTLNRIKTGSCQVFVT